MYTKIFMITDGNMAFDTLGLLEELRSMITNTVVWVAGGTASLILFLKCIGLSYTQMTHYITQLECLPLLVYGGSLEPYNNIKLEMDEWIDAVLETTKLFNNKSTLADIYKYTGIYASFITSNGLLEPTSKTITLKEAVMASLCNIGTYDSYEVGTTKYAHVSTHNPYPMDIKASLNVDNIKTLYIANYNKITLSTDNWINQIENKLVQEYYDRVLQLLKCKKCDDIIVLNGVFKKNKLQEYEIKQNLANGHKHGELFKDGTDTINYMEELLNYIRNQS